jgi:hypothetical protein
MRKREGAEYHRGAVLIEINWPKKMMKNATSADQSVTFRTARTTSLVSCHFCHSDAGGGGICDAVARDKLNKKDAAVANKIPPPHAASE